MSFFTNGAAVGEVETLDQLMANTSIKESVYDDYLEDYYECILGYEHKGMVCRYWRKYAEKHGFYQKGAPVQQQNNAVAPAPAPQQPLPNTQQVPAQQPQAPAVTNQYNQMVPYTPAH